MRAIVMRSASVALVAAAAVAVAGPTKADDAQGTSCNNPVNFANQGTGARPGPATLVPIFWGEAPSNSLSEEESVFDGVYSQIEQSNYYRWIRSEYGAPELHHVPPTSTVYPGELSGTINDSDIQSQLSSWVRSGATPNVSNPVYVLHLPPGVMVNGKICSPWQAYNAVFQSFDLFNGGFIGFYYIVVPEVGTCGLTFDGVTRLLAHEIIESVTDGAYFNVTGAHLNGWEDPSQPSSCGDQIGDLCDGIPTVIQSPAQHWVPGVGYTHSLTVQKMWSNAMHACVTEDASTIPTVSSMTAPTMVNGNMPIGGPGTVVTITGTNFEGVPTVQFGGTTSYGVSCASSTQCTATAPPGVEGTVQVTFSENGTTLNIGEYTYPPTTAPSCTVTTAGCGLVTYSCPGADSNYALVAQWYSPQTGTWVQQPFSSEDHFTTATPETVRFCYGSYAGVVCGSPITFTPDLTGLVTSCNGACGKVPNGCGGTLDCGACTGPSTCDGQSKPGRICKSSRGWVCCGSDGWECGVCQ